MSTQNTPLFSFKKINNNQNKLYLLQKLAADRYETHLNKCTSLKEQLEKNIHDLELIQEINISYDMLKGAIEYALNLLYENNYDLYTIYNYEIMKSFDIFIDAYSSDFDNE